MTSDLKQNLLRTQNFMRRSASGATLISQTVAANQGDEFELPGELNNAAPKALLQELNKMDAQDFYIPLCV